MSYVERVINLTITLQPKQGNAARNIAPDANPTFAGTDSNVVKIQGGGPAAQNGVRIAAKITRPGGVSLGAAEVQIYNLPLTLINQLGTLGFPYIYMVGPNQITIEAGDVGKVPEILFSGTIFSAYADLAGAPNSIFNISAQVGVDIAAAPAAATSFTGQVDVAGAMAGFAKQAGLTLENRGVTAQLSYSYFSGSVMDQIKAIAEHAGISWTIDDANNVLAIWPKNGSRTPPEAAVPVISPDNGMVGYPTYTANGLRLKTEYTSAIGYGTTIEVRNSQLKQANGKWIVTYLDYDLECQAENGPWFTNLEVAAPGYPVLSTGSR
jgi:hypothetical protein